MRSKSRFGTYGKRILLVGAVLAGTALAYSQYEDSKEEGAIRSKDDSNQALSPYEMHLKHRIEEIKQSAPVTLNTSDSILRKDVGGDEKIDVVSTEISGHSHEARAEVVSPGTTHQAPYVDKDALNSITEKASAFSQNGGNPVIKLGRHADGSAMTVREREQLIRTTLTQIPDEWTVAYKADNERLRIYTFTDPTCPFCQRKHTAIPELLANGISVHYLLYPRDMSNSRQGPITRNAQNMMNAWCAPDQKAAFDDMFDGYRVPSYDCAQLPAGSERIDPPVIDHLMIGELFDVTGTPSIFASNGRSVEGFSDVGRLIQVLIE